MLLLMCEVKKMSSDKTIGQIIAEAREKSNLSQRQLAKLAGINSSGLSKIEAGERDPNPKTLRKISNYIDVNYSDLMYKLGLGIEVSPLNPFIKDYYSKLKGEELNEA
jgi:transcriptional regulator with XRE-family HTH domain